MVDVPTEPTLELIEASLLAAGFTGKFHRETMNMVRQQIGTPHEPGVCSQVRAVLAVLNGVALSEIKRGYNPAAAPARKPRRRALPSRRTG